MLSGWTSLMPHSAEKGSSIPSTCNQCDQVYYITFTDFCHVVHQTKHTRSLFRNLSTTKRGVLLEIFFTVDS